MSSLEPLLTYYRGNSGFIQRFLINQNGSPYDLTLVSGVLSVKWWWKAQKPGATAKSIDWSGTIDGANNNRVSFSMPNAFLDEGGIDYDCNIEVYNDGILVLHTDPDFIVRVKEPSGVHTDP